jgi:hypothetical protein
MSFTLDGKRICFYISEAMVKSHGDGSRHFYPAIVTEHEPGYNPTDWDFGTDFKLAQEAVISLNSKRGVSQAEATEIVTSSMFPRSQTAS